MPEQPSYSSDELDLPRFAGETPLHGYRGDRPAEPAGLPSALTVAISRETGARGTTIAQQAGTKLGWQVYPQDLLEFVMQDAAARQEVFQNLSPSAAAWVEEQLQRLARAETISSNPSVIELARVLLHLSARGEVIVV